MYQFQKQFGKYLNCSCKTPLDLGKLEIVSETENTILAHYLCPNCGREQTLAASVGIIEEAQKKQPFNTLTSDDVLDIRQELKKIKAGQLKSLFKTNKKNQTQPDIGTSFKEELI